MRTFQPVPIFTPRSLAKIKFLDELYAIVVFHYTQPSLHLALVFWVAIFVSSFDLDWPVQISMNINHDLKPSALLHSHGLLFFLLGNQNWTTIADLGHEFKFSTLYQVDELSIFKKPGLFLKAYGMFSHYSWYTSALSISVQFSLFDLIKWFLLSICCEH